MYISDLKIDKRSSRINSDEIYIFEASTAKLKF